MKITFTCSIHKPTENKIGRGDPVSAFQDLIDLLRMEGVGWDSQSRIKAVLNGFPLNNTLQSTSSEWLDTELVMYTAWSGFSYTFRFNQIDSDYCDRVERPWAVTYEGPVNGFLRQNLMPDMRLVRIFEVSGTSGTFTRDGCADKGPLAPLEAYMVARHEKEVNITDYVSGYHVSEASHA